MTKLLDSTGSKAEATASRILEAAKTLFLARPYADVTMTDIAREAAVTKGAVYHHFESKEELYLALLHGDLARKRELHAVALGSGGSARERLAMLTRAFFAQPRAARQLTRLVRRDVNVFTDPQRAELIRAYQRALPELCEQILRDGQRDGEIAPGDPRLLSWHFVAMVEVVLGAYADSLFADIDARLDHVLDLFFRGAGA